MPLKISINEIRSFRGGLTEDLINIRPDQALRIDNILLTNEDHMIQRPGSLFFDANNPQLPSGNQRVNALINFSNDANLISVAGTRAFWWSPSTWTEFTGPTGNYPFPSSLITSNITHAQWKGHLFATDNTGSPVIKIYKDGSGNFQLRTAGLPAVENNPNYDTQTVLTSAITLANNMRTQFLAHFASTAEHILADAVSAAFITAPAATNLATLITLTTQLLRAMNNHVLDVTITVALYHVVSQYTPSYSPYRLLPSTLAAPTDLESVAQRLGDMYELWNEIHDNSTVNIYHKVLAGLFPITAAQLITLTDGPVLTSGLLAVYSTFRSLAANFYAHAADLTMHTGTEVFPPSNNPATLNITPSAAGGGITAANSLALQINSFIVDYTTHENDAAQNSPSYHHAIETSSHQLSGYGSIAGQPSANGCWLIPNDATLAECIVKLIEIIQEYNSHDNDPVIHTTVSIGRHQATNPDFLGGTLASTGQSSYEYAFIRTITYTNGTETFRTTSHTLIKQNSDAQAVEFSPMVISSIPVLSNGSIYNFDTTNVMVEIYRTQNAGTQFFLVGSIANGTTSFTDYMSDETLINQTPLYTNGGTVDTDIPPISKFLHVLASGLAYYGGVINAGQLLSRRIQQSIPGFSPDLTNNSFFVDLADDVTGISSVRNIPLAFTSKNVYRLDGQFDSLGRGSITAIPISNQTGLSASFSPVQIEGAVLFAGKDGFYVTDGYTAKRVNDQWNRAYLNIIRSQKARDNIQGALDKATNKIWWAASTTGLDNDSAYIMDLHKGISEGSSFTTASGGSSFAPTAVCFFNDDLIRGDLRGYVFRHDQDISTDPVVDLTISTANWLTQPVIYEYWSPWFDMGTLRYRKQNNEVLLKALNVGNASIQMSALIDMNNELKNMVPIRIRSNIVWGDPTIIWGNTTCVWNPSGLIDEKRRPPTGHLRFSNIQIQLTNAYVVVQASDQTGLGTLNQSAKTLTLPSGNFYNQVAGLYLALENDNYSTQYPIASASTTVLTVTDTGGVLPANGSYKWQIMGIPKNEFIRIMSYAFWYGEGDMSQHRSGGESGVNA